jgi:hypothetical protein
MNNLSMTCWGFFMFLRGSHFESFRPIHSDAPTLGSGGLPQVGATDVEDGERHLCGDQV